MSTVLKTYYRYLLLVQGLLSAQEDHQVLVYPLVQENQDVQVLLGFPFHLLVINKKKIYVNFFLGRL